MVSFSMLVDTINVSKLTNASDPDLVRLVTVSIGLAAGDANTINGYGGTTATVDVTAAAAAAIVVAILKNLMVIIPLANVEGSHHLATT